MYNRFYGFREEPFSLLPDPDFLYLSDAHESALNLLELAIANQSGFCVLSGEIGAGKTTIVRALLNRIDGRIRTGLVSNTASEYSDLLRWIMNAFDLNAGSGEPVYRHRQFTDFVIQQYAGGGHTLLIVDEAQNLSVSALEELRMLSNVNSEKDLLLQVILVGQPGLRQKLQRPQLAQLAQRIAHDYHLGALTQTETTAYIKHRLKKAGGSATLFDRDALDIVYRRSGGIPRLINRICDLGLVYGFGAAASVIDAEVMRVVEEEQKISELLPASGIRLVDNRAVQGPGCKPALEAAGRSRQISEQSGTAVHNKPEQQGDESMSKQPQQKPSRPERDIPPAAPAAGKQAADTGTAAARPRNDSAKSPDAVNSAAERAAAERAHAEQVAREIAAAASAAIEKAAADRAIAEKALAARQAAEKDVTAKENADAMAGKLAAGSKEAAAKAEKARREAEEAARDSDAKARRAAEQLTAAQQAAKTQIEEKTAAERSVREQADAARAAAEKALAERIAAEKAAAEAAQAADAAVRDALRARVEVEKAMEERLAGAQRAAEQAAAAQAEAKRIAGETAAAQQQAEEKARADEKFAARAAEEKAAALAAAREKAVEAMVAAEHADATRTEAEQVVAEQEIADKVAAAKATAEKVALAEVASQVAAAAQQAAEQAAAARVAALQEARDKEEAAREAAKRAAEAKAAAQQAAAAEQGLETVIEVEGPAVPDEPDWKSRAVRDLLEARTPPPPIVKPAGQRSHGRAWAIMGLTVLVAGGSWLVLKQGHLAGDSELHVVARKAPSAPAPTAEAAALEVVDRVDPKQ